MHDMTDTDRQLVADTHAAIEALRETFLALGVDDLIEQVRGLAAESLPGEWIPRRFTDDSMGAILAFDLAAPPISHTITSWENHIAKINEGRSDAATGIATAIAALEASRKTGAS